MPGEQLARMISGKIFPSAGPLWPDPARCVTRAARVQLAEFGQLAERSCGILLEFLESHALEVAGEGSGRFRGFNVVDRQSQARPEIVQFVIGRISGGAEVEFAPLNAERDIERVAEDMHDPRVRENLQPRGQKQGRARLFQPQLAPSRVRSTGQRPRSPRRYAKVVWNWR